MENGKWLKHQKPNFLFGFSSSFKKLLYGLKNKAELLTVRII